MNCVMYSSIKCIKGKPTDAYIKYIMKVNIYRMQFISCYLVNNINVVLTVEKPLHMHIDKF